MFAPVLTRIQKSVESADVFQTTRTFSTAAPAVASSVSGVPQADPVQSSCFGQFTRAVAQDPVLLLYPIAPISSPVGPPTFASRYWMKMSFAVWISVGHVPAILLPG